MASETKVEPAVKAPGATRLRGVEADDENVSLDELMISDSDDEDEEDEATDIHPPLVRDLDDEAAPQLAAAGRRAFDAEPPARAKADTSSFDTAEDEPAPSSAAASSDAPEVVIIAEDDSNGDDREEIEAAEALQRAHAAEEPLVARSAKADSAEAGSAEADSAGADSEADDFDADAADADLEPDSLVPDTVEPVTLAVPELSASDTSEASDRADEPELAAAAALEAPLAHPREVELTEPEASPEPLEPPRREPALRARVADAPLPSFDIPDLEVEAPPLRADKRPSAPPVADKRPSAPPVAVLAPVSESGDDDAVTHMGLPTSEMGDEYPELEVSGFESGDPGVAAMREFDPNVSVIDARRATTRLIPRIDPALLKLPPEPAPAVAAEPKTQWLADKLRSTDVRRKVAWVLDNVLPPLSLVLFGSGIGAGIMLLQPDRSAAPESEVQQQAQALKEAPGAPKRGSTWLDSAEAGDADALAKIEKLPPRERTAEMTLAFETGQRARRLAEFKSLVGTLEDPAAAPPAGLASRVIDYATTPETLVPAFQTLARWEGSQGPDLLYAVWERAPGGSRAASLAQQLLQGADQRSKASAALLVALDLRNSASCEDYAKLLPSVQRDGDQRSSATLRALEHKDGCGDDGRADCFRCLRKGTALASALRATESRPGPQL
jgi:hypothetical protein